MNITFYDKNKHRMERNFRFFLDKDDISFIAVGSVGQISSSMLISDLIIIYQDEENPISFENTKNMPIFLMCNPHDTKSKLFGFSIGAKIFDDTTSPELLYELISNENSKLQAISHYKKVTLNKCIDNILQKTFIPTYVNGYHYIKTALELCYEKPVLADSVTKILYPTMAKHMSTSSSCIERSMRFAISRGWNENSEFYKKQLCLPTTQRPSNKQFLNAVLAYMERTLK